MSLLEERPRGASWFSKYGDGQIFLAESSAAFKFADAPFTVADEPTDAISQWRDDASEIAGDAQQWYLSTDGATTTIDGAFARLDVDVAAVRNFNGS